jgi:hypothetical protein
MIEGDQFSGALGTSLGPAGDVNGDGFVVGASRYDNDPAE